MRQSYAGPESLPVSERLATLGHATANALIHKAVQKHETEQAKNFRVSQHDAERIVSDWPTAPKKCAYQMMSKYGAPNEATPSKLFWYRKGPWKRIVVSRDVIMHDFPSPHSDYLTQWIDYSVPVEKFADLGRFDGSCLVDRTAGEAGARCDSEAANTITLNLMHDIVTGARTVDDARRIYADSMAAYAVGRHAPYAARLMFEPARGDTHDPDHANIGPAIAHQISGKLDDWLGRHAPQHEPGERNSRDRKTLATMGAFAVVALLLLSRLK